MAIPLEFSGSDGVLLIDGFHYLFSRLRLHIHGDAGDISVSEFAAKRRNGTLADWEITITKPSFDPTNNPWAVPWTMELFSYHNITFYPGGLLNPPYLLEGGLLDDFGHEDDVNQEQPTELHFVCGEGIPAVFE